MRLEISGTDLEARLRRVEGKLDMLLRVAEGQEIARDIGEEIRAAYRRGYQVGRHAQRRGDPEDADGAVARQRHRIGSGAA